MDNQPWRKPFWGLYNFKLREGSFPALFMTPAPRVGYWEGAGLLGGEGDRGEKSARICRVSALMNDCSRRDKNNILNS